MVEAHEKVPAHRLDPVDRLMRLCAGSTTPPEEWWTGC